GSYANNLPQANAIRHALKNCWVRYDGGSLRPFLAFSASDTSQAFVDFCVNAGTRQERRAFWNSLPRKYQKPTSPYSTLGAAFAVIYQAVFTFLRTAKRANRDKRLISFSQMVLEC